MTDVRHLTTGDRVRSALTQAGIKQEEAAAEVGISQGQLSRRIAGRIEFRADELAALARLCGVPVASLIADATEVAA